ncbi:uncharacterized protein TNCV_1080531 [Trichonephila clavipes]|nr:uncharacterized protein TNCV_1080531 [Trichonephila clavipes]
MPLRKRSVRALQMNEKRWCKAKIDCEVNKNSVFSNVRLEKLNTVKILYGDEYRSFSSTTYGKCARRLDNAYTLASENIFAEIHREIKNVYENGAEITDLSVSFDGTWLTRGHTSLIGVGCVIDMLTGYVVDFEVMSKVCRHCSVAKNKLGQSSAEFSIWYEGHKSECDINHLGSIYINGNGSCINLVERSTSLWIPLYYSIIRW